MTKTTRFLTAPSAEGPDITIPVATIEGQGDGPTVLVVAGVHGSEYTGLEAVRRLHRSLDPEQLLYLSHPYRPNQTGPIPKPG